MTYNGLRKIEIRVANNGNPDIDIRPYARSKVNTHEVCKIYNVNRYKHMLLIHVLTLPSVMLIKTS